MRGQACKHSPLGWHRDRQAGPKDLTVPDNRVQSNPVASGQGTEESELESRQQAKAGSARREWGQLGGLLSGLAFSPHPRSSLLSRAWQGRFLIPPPGPPREHRSEKIPAWRQRTQRGEHSCYCFRIGVGECNKRQQQLCIFFKKGLSLGSLLQDHSTSSLLSTSS